jgi:large subunit ribosomal protein L13e
MIFKPVTIKEGRGFSVLEIQSVGLTPGEAKIFGIPVDVRRRSSHEENIEILKDFVSAAKKNEVKVSQPKQITKGQKSRAERGLTSAGQKSRGLTRGKKKN